MRQTQIITAALLITGVVALLGVTVINAKSDRHASFARTSGSIDVMQMMRNAKDLPVQQFDAH
jgi:hypothetical protein